jgi:4-hydroxybenzoate polyprenyltransferase
VNDIADEDVDRVNHPGDAARPLVSGTATPSDLRRLHGLACAVALLAAAQLGLEALALVAASLAIGVLYSLPPARLSYRTWLAPVALAAAYVLVPYGLGAIAARRDLAAANAWLAAALLALFLARIVLKDYRDRTGDARYGKPTLVLRFGSTPTCAVSLAALLSGEALLLAALRPPVALAIPLEALMAGIAVLLARLRAAADPRSEQVAIGLGARLGNGVLLAVLAWLVLAGEAAPPGVVASFTWAPAALFGVSVAALAGAA